MSHRPHTVALFLLLLALYLFTFDLHSDGMLLGNDAIPYARALAGAPHALWHANHLLFHLLAALLANAYALLSGGEIGFAEAWRAQKLLSAIGGALSAAFLFHFAAGLLGVGRAGLLTIAFALSTVMWMDSSVGESYTPASAPVAALLVGALACVPGLTRARPLGSFGITAWLLLAVLLRQDGVLVVPALMLMLPRERWFPPVATGGVLALSLYLLAWIASGMDTAFSAWLLGLASYDSFGKFLSPASLLSVLHVLVLGLNYAGWGTPSLSFATWGLALAALVPSRRLTPAVRRAALALLAYIGVRIVFFAWWWPLDLEFQTGTMVPLFLLLALLLDPGAESIRARRRQTLLLAAFAVVVGAGTWFTFIGPNRDDVIHRRVLRAIELVRPHGLIVSLDAFQNYSLLREKSDFRFMNASLVAAHPPGEPPAVPEREREGLRRRIERELASGRPLVMIRDTVMLQRLGLPAFPLPGLTRLLPERDALALRDEGDPKGEIWGLYWPAQSGAPAAR